MHLGSSSHQLRLGLRIPWLYLQPPAITPPQLGDQSVPYWLFPPSAPTGTIALMAPFGSAFRASVFPPVPSWSSGILGSTLDARLFGCALVSTSIGTVAVHRPPGFISQVSTMGPPSLDFAEDLSPGCTPGYSCSPLLPGSSRCHVHYRCRK
ncbi:hypothetical protein PO909_023421 [Leuciscus waleckii]